MASVSIRGAITANDNTNKEILDKTEILLKEIIKANNIKNEDIISIVFTATRDLDQAYPAVAARKIGITNASLMCVQEMYVVGSLEKCIRVMLSAESGCNQKDVFHVYLEGAKVLRPDLCNNLEVKGNE